MELLLLEDRLAVVSRSVGVAAYDFDFGLYFRCSHPMQFEPGTVAVLRIGGVQDYEAEFAEKAEWGLPLVNSPQQYRRASELEAWYPLIEELTPRTQLFAELPPVETIEANFSWPVFIKGSRQTSRHDPELSVIRSPDQYARLCDRYTSDPILRWQKAAVREFIPLQPVGGSVPGKVRPSLEFRSFWWNGRCVGVGCYWYQVPRYDCADLADGVAMAERVAQRLQVPFLVVDFARTVEGRWIVIECNDGQESGYAGIGGLTVWRRILQYLV